MEFYFELRAYALHLHGNMCKKENNFWLGTSWIMGKAFFPKVLIFLYCFYYFKKYCIVNYEFFCIPIVSVTMGIC